MSLDEQIAAVERELAMRHKVYPGFVKKGKMTRAKADHEIAAMEAVLATLKTQRGDVVVVQVATTDAEEGPSTYQQAIAIYDQFIRDRSGVPAKIDGAQGNAMKSILQYLRGVAKNQNEGDAGALNALRFIFEKWGYLSLFIQTQVSLSQINKNLPEIIDTLKNGGNRKQADSAGREQGAARAARRMRERAPR